MTQDTYTGAQASFSYADAPFAAGEIDITITRGVAASGPRLGKYSQYKVPGEMDFEATVKRIQVDGELLAALLTATPTTGTAEDLKLARSVAADGWVDNTDTEIATPSRIRITVATAAMTTAGYLVLVGEDADGNHIEEAVSVGLLGIGEYATGSTIFLKVYGTYNHGIRSTGVGTLTIHSIAGDSTANVAEPKIWNMVARVDDSTNNIIITANNCFFTKGSFKIAGANDQLKDDMTFTMRDPDADLTVSYVNA